MWFSVRNTLMTKPAVLTTLGLFALCSVMVVCAAVFANVQAIWVDESTQLSGLTLGFREQALWLSGQMDHPFAVPADRMPPISYWLGKLWAGVFGLTEGSLRSFGIVMALCAMPALFLSGRLAGGLMGGLFAVAFLFTQPSFIIHTVEIRAYPLFFCLSAWAVYAFIYSVTRPEGSQANRAMVALTALLVAMSYTHFYGVVASGFFFLTLLIDHLWFRKPLKVLLICGVVGAGLLAGLLPFAMKAVSMTGSSSHGGGIDLGLALSDSVRLIFRLVSSQVLFSTPIALAGALAGVAVLGGCLTYMVLFSKPKGMTKPLLITLLPLVLSLIILTAIRARVTSFEILAPHYNLWLLPLVAAVFAFAFSLKGAWARRIVMIAGVGVIAFQLVGLSALMRHKTLYTHGPGEAILAVITDPRTTLVVHDADSHWGQSYFPLSYLTNGQVTQWLSYPDGRAQHITKTGLRDIADPQAEIESFAKVMRVQTQSLDSQTLADIAYDPAVCQLPLGDLLITQDPDTITTFCAYFAASFTVSPVQ